MPLFQYKALNVKGRRKSGLIDALDEREAKEKLRSMGIMVVSLSAKVKVSKRQNLKGEKLLAFTLQLSQLLDAGIPLYESLCSIEQQCRQESHHRIILSLCEQIKAGASLSQAMSAYPDSFNHLYCSMIFAGEAVGALNVVLEKLTNLLTRQMKLQGDISTALIYPAILAGFALLVIGMLLGFVVPSIEGIFAERKLNGFTAFILSVSYIFRTYWWAYVPVVGALTVWGVYQLQTPQGRLWIQRVSLKVPLLRSLVIQASLARFCRTLGTLQQGGLPLIEAMKIAREVTRNIVLEEEIKKAELRIIEGGSLGKELARSKWFPPMVTQMLAVGEESGSMTNMLNRIADMYENDLEKSINRALALAQPLILVVMGLIIGAVLLAVLLPLTDVSSLAF